MDGKGKGGFNFTDVLVVCWWAACLFVVFFFSGCSVGILDEQESDLGDQDKRSRSSSPCVVRSVVYPVERRDFQRIYRRRAFLTDGVHLGYDVDLPEGAPIRAIACGVVRIYRAAQGYGTLAVVIEHRLEQPLVVQNGLGELVSIDRFLSIYGHLTKTGGTGSSRVTQSWRTGNVVQAGDVIGYVQNAEDNGDGDEHLHLGIRLQAQTDAARVDINWFRGYDAHPSQSRWFADPPIFLDRLIALQDAFFDAGPNVQDAVIVPIDPRRVSHDSGVPYLDVAMADHVMASDVGSYDAHESASCRYVSGMREICTNHVDDNCDSLIDCADPGCASDSACASRPATDAGTAVRDVFFSDSASSTSALRYEFRILESAGWAATEPYRLRDMWWRPQTCRNTGSVEMERVEGGWRRCDLGARLSPFDGSFFTPLHPDWGDRGQLGTVGNAPERCTPVRGAEWRITDLTSRRLIYQGPASGLPCIAVGSQDRLRLPD